jgi:hypothetical protein
MQTYGSIIPGGPTLARMLPKAASEAHDPPRSRETKRRLIALRWHGTSSTVRGASKTAAADRTRCVSPHGRWISSKLSSSCARSTPRWGKDKLVVILRQQGLAISVSMVGRIPNQPQARPASTACRPARSMDGRPLSDSALRYQEAERLRTDSPRKPRPDRQCRRAAGPRRPHLQAL